MWKYYFQNTKALIYVIDSADSERFEIARETLQSIVTDEDMRDVPILVLANKQDITTLTTTDVANKLNLQELQGQKWHVQPTIAIQGKGITEGLDWLCQILKNKK